MTQKARFFKVGQNGGSKMPFLRSGMPMQTDSADSHSNFRTPILSGSGKKRRSPGYLYQKGNIFYFRYAFSAHERERLQHAEIRISLRTGFVHEAKKNARHLCASLEEFMEKNRDNISYEETREHLCARLKELMDSSSRKNPPSIAVIRERMDQLRQKMLDNADADLYIPHPAIDIENGNPNEALTSGELLSLYFQAFQKNITGSPEALIKVHYPDAIIKLLQKNIFSLDELTPDSILQILNEYHKLQISFNRIMAARENGDYSYERNFRVAPVIESTGEQSKIEKPVIVSEPCIHEAIEAYCAEKQRTGQWTDRTAKDFIPKLRFFSKQLGDLEVCALDRQHIRDFKNIIDKLPAGYGKEKTYRNVPLEKIMEGIVPLEKRMRPTSLNKYYGVINSFIIWMQKNYDNIQIGIEKIMNISVSGQKDLIRSIFSEEDLRKIFLSQQYINKSFREDYKYWVPLIGYYTGMRLEEICQLYLSDIKEENNIWYFDIIEDNDKHVKTASGIRKVPIHDDMIDKFGFLNFVNKQKNKKQERLFPELKKQSGRYSHYASRWFGQYLLKVGVKDKGGAKVFHSFRHTFINACKLAGVEEYKVKEVVGHEVGSKSITYGRYGKKYPLDILYQDVIMKIPSLLFLYDEQCYKNAVEL